MNIFLIDFENVHYEGLSGILNLTEEDEVYIFYSENGKRLTFELHEQINRSKAKFYYYKADVGGKNALDHQLSTYLGFLIGKTDIKNYYIVSKDRGFRYLVAFWQSANLDLQVCLVDNIKISRTTNTTSTEGLEPVARKARTQVASVAAKKQLANVDEGSSKPARTDDIAAKADKDTEAKEKTAAQKKVREYRKTGLQAKAELSKKEQEENAKTTQPKAAELEKTALAAKPERKKRVSGVAQQVKETPAKESKTPQVIEFVLPEEVLALAKTTAEPADSKKADKEQIIPEKPATVDAQKIAAKLELSTDKKKFNVNDIAKMIPDSNDEDWLGDIVEYINNAKNKADLYNMIRRRFGQDQGRNIYNTIKKHI